MEERRRWRGGKEIDEHKIDEMLELIWTLRETGRDYLRQVLENTREEDAESTLGEMERRALVQIKGSEITLTREGETWAREIIRRHRLAERLLSEVFELEEKHIHPEACKFEHILSPEVTDSVCAFLGHPPLCPHGNPIPRGKCCVKFKTEAKPLVMPLLDLEPGDAGRIVFIVPKEHTRLDRLGSLGVIPGSTIKLHQKRPSFVIKIGETELAIDEEIAREIYVKKRVKT
ncbi:MAG: metal-dependent transcriptional regulator [Candidatus Hydrothermarchaeota archaeon]|nr:metal-dependent transcriptional regulator [Candidatus Hydrothermarchaeota archaeon]